MNNLTDKVTTIGYDKLYDALTLAGAALRVMRAQPGIPSGVPTKNGGEITFVEAITTITELTAAALADKASKLRLVSTPEEAL